MVLKILWSLRKHNLKKRSQILRYKIHQVAQLSKGNFTFIASSLYTILLQKYILWTSNTIKREKVNDLTLISCLFKVLLQSLQHIYAVVQVAKSCPTLCDPMDCSTPGFSVLHYLPEFAHIHVHWVGDAI